MNTQMLEWFNRPEYIYQPDKIIRRLFGREPRTSRVIVELPWKLPLEVDNSDVIGSAISHHGIFELLVVEAIFRLVDPSDTVIDVGANIGYMTAVAISAGAKKVVSIEPHPALFAILSRNVDRWNRNRQFPSRVDALREAVSSESGGSTLFVPKVDFAGNHGLSTLEMRADKPGYDEVQVSCTTLDFVIGQLCAPIGLLKIDIEGHEAEALKGTEDSLRSGRIRDIIYENYGGVNSETSKLLADYGYSIFGLRKSVVGPILIETLKAGETRSIDFNLLATLEPDRLRRRMLSRGYRCLRARKVQICTEGPAESQRNAVN